MNKEDKIWNEMLRAFVFVRPDYTFEVNPLVKVSDRSYKTGSGRIAMFYVEGPDDKFFLHITEGGETIFTSHKHLRNLGERPDDTNFFYRP